MLIKKIKNLSINLLLLLFSTSLILLISELVIRSVLEPVDYSRPDAQKDEILGHKIEAYSGNHDAWGFRNLSIPQQANIIAIGDSFTYGQGVPRYYSWPAVLEIENKTPVYNMGMGGYGIVEYFHLLKTKAFLLSPKQVIIAVYLGNDLMDSFKAVYSRRYWAKLRNPKLNNYNELDQSQFIFYQQEKSNKWFPQLRIWLYRHSVLYNAFKTTFTEKLEQLKFQQGKQSSQLTTFDNGHVRLTFAPEPYLALLNLEDERIREGMRIGLQLLLEMSMLCENNNISFGVVLIPTKVNIYAEYFQSQSQLPHSQTIEQLIHNENQIIQTFESFLQDHDINYINIGIALGQAKEKSTLYPTHNDAHFNREGHMLVAKVLSSWLKQNDKLSY